ncbi:MAG: hypothetical protein EPN88_03145 [Bacteroidetes bacterium]|nr:MAG: hypothetical protein EPN88_03145 [Bacteroidota bacterium]
MILIRFILISVIIYLIIRSFVNYGKEQNPIAHKSDPENNNATGKKVSKEIGEYVDYEELDKQK